MEAKPLRTTTIPVKTITYIGLTTALMCILGPMSIPIGLVPISLGNLAVFLVAILLGGKWGTISVLTYLLLGAVGMPVFSGYTGGLGKLLGPTGGYLIAFLFTPAIIAFFGNLWKKQVYMTFIGMLVSNCVIYLLGSAWLAYQANMTMGAAFATGVIPFVLLDFIKTVAAFVVAIPVKKTLEKSNLGITCK
ncbi:MAG: biotin transporter BioY [Eubacteriales bacterium]